MTKLELATEIIQSAFAGKTDLAGQPYIDHLQRVCDNINKYLLNSYRSDQQTVEEIGVIALLHDLYEDCQNWTRDHIIPLFGSSVNTTVKTLTRTSNQSYDDYIEKIGQDIFAIIVKLADLEDNMNITRLSELTEKDIKRLQKYYKAYRYLYQKLKG